MFTLLDTSRSTTRLLSLAVGGVLVDAVGIRPVFWLGGALLPFASLQGLALLGRSDACASPARKA